MKVTLRKRNQGGQTSLYLDYYNKGKRKTEYLKLYLKENPRTKEEKELNKSTLQLAETIKAQRQIELQNGEYGFRNLEKQKASFIAYLELLISRKQISGEKTHNLICLMKHLKTFCKADISFVELDHKFILEFKNYLDTKAVAYSHTLLSNNTKYIYFHAFRYAINQAVKEGIIATSNLQNVTSFKLSESVKEFLTLEELKAAVKEECSNPAVKAAFLFACLTGLRWSDVEKLKWSELQHSNEMGNYIRFTQKKTKGKETLPISEQALELLGERKETNEKVFKELVYSDSINNIIQKWLKKAGITKKITFHCARHTYATLQLTLGTDIYTVSKLLGHRDLKSTQVYAKIIDLKKKEAASKIKL